MKSKGDYQGLKPLQAYARSIYWSLIWPSITSRYTIQINVRQHVQEVNGQVIGVVINVNAPSPVSAFNRVVRQPLEALLDEERGQIVILDNRDLHNSSCFP